MKKTHFLPLALFISFLPVFTGDAYGKYNRENVAEVSVLRFGAKPDDGKDDTEALRKAAEYCRTHPGTTLVIPKGIYRLKDKEAERLVVVVP